MVTTTNRPRLRVPQRLSCATCRCRHASEWHVLTDEQVGYMDRNKSVLLYRAGTMLHQEGNPVTGLFSLEEGTVGMRVTNEDGHALLLELAFPGQLLGYRAYFNQGTHDESAVALEDCVVCHIDRRIVAELLRDNPALAPQFLKRLAVDVKTMAHKLAECSWLSVHSRLCKLLVELVEHFGGNEQNGGIHITPPLTRQDYAELLGVRTETAARAFRTLEDEGLIRMQRRTVTIPDMHRLMEHAGQD